MARDTTNRRLASRRWFFARRPSSAIHSRSPCNRAAIFLPGVQLLLGEQTRFDALGQFDLLFSVEERNLADLLEIVLHRVRSCAGLGDLLHRLIGIVHVRQNDLFALGRGLGGVVLKCREILREIGFEFRLESGCLLEIQLRISALPLC